jgi:predicted translin family RNA/ssDNA-binding protein
LYHFYQTGRLLPLSQLTNQPGGVAPTPTDSEYIASVIAFAGELNRYTINRACSLDLPSVKLTKELITEIYQVLLEFDFRNGPLRRRFDSVKYSLKAIENTFYELNLQNNIMGTEKEQEKESNDEQVAKKARTGEPTSPIPLANTSVPDPAQLAITSKFSYLSGDEFGELVRRMAEYDQARESIIKESRDIQKAAKQAIYAIMRNQLPDSRNKLNFCRQKANKILTEILVKVIFDNSIRFFCFLYLVFTISILVYDKDPSVILSKNLSRANSCILGCPLRR